MKALKSLLKYLFNESGKGGSSEQRIVHEKPEPRPAELELNKTAIELGQLQAEEMRRRSDLLTNLAPEREKLLQSQIGVARDQYDTMRELMPTYQSLLEAELANRKQTAGMEGRLSPLKEDLLGLQLQTSLEQAGLKQELAPQQRALIESELTGREAMLGVAGQAQGLLQTQTPDLLMPSVSTEDTRRELRELLTKKGLAKIRGEEDLLSDEEERRVTELEDLYTGRARRDLGGLGTKYAQEAEAEGIESGLLPDDTMNRLLSEETERQISRTGKMGRLTGLQQRLGAQERYYQTMEPQRRFQDQYAEADLANRMNLYGSLASGAPTSALHHVMPSSQPSTGQLFAPAQISMPTTQAPQLPSVGAPTQLSQALEAMKRDRESMASQYTQGAPYSRTQTGMSGGISGASTGALIGGALALPTGGLSVLAGAGIGAVGGGLIGSIFGYNA